MMNGELELEDGEIDPCTGFPTVNKCKLSIPSISWNKSGRAGSISSTCTPPLSPIDEVIQYRMEILSNSRWKRYIGILLTVCSAIAFSFNALIAKVLTHMHPFNLGFWTFLLMTLFAIPSLIYEAKVKKNSTLFEIVNPFGKSGNGKVAAFLFIRAFCGVSALTFFFYAVKYLTVADALVIDGSSPIFVYLMAFFFLGEKCGFIPVFTTILAFIGVTLITRPPLLTNESDYDIRNLIGVMLAFSCMLCITITVITLKFLENVHLGVINFAFGLWGTFQCLLESLVFGVLSVPSEWSDVVKILATAILFYVGQACITVALKYEDAGPVGLVRTTELLFIFHWQFLFLGVVPDAYSCIGALLILLGVVLIVIRKWISGLDPTSKFRNSCKFLLY